jgi:EPS-associated MarR family transcriptional regulator
VLAYDFMSVQRLNGTTLNTMLTDEYRYKILKILEANPEVSQRDLARALDISLGRVNFCLKALIEKGLLKATNFRNSQNKLAYMYLLTPSGIEEKSAITAQFLKIKIQEYANLEAEIDQLRREAIQTNKQQLNLGLTQQQVRI